MTNGNRDRQPIFTLARTRQSILGVLVLAPLVLAAAFYLLHPVLAIEPDSQGYLVWSADRSSGYPLFLKVVRGPLVLGVQLLLLACATAWAVFRVYRLWGSLLLCALLDAAFLGNPYVWQLQGSMMSEALTAPLLVILVGLLAGYVRRQHRGTAFGASIVVGMVASVRPSDLLLVAVPPLAVIVSGTGGYRSKLLSCLLCLAVSSSVLVADRLCTHAVHGSATTSLLGRHFFAKGALVDAPRAEQPGFSPLERQLAGIAEERFASIRQTLAALSNRRHVLDALEPNYEVCLQYACTDAYANSLEADRARLNAALFRVGVARLRQEPGAYLRLSADEYRRLWLLNPRKDPALASEFNAYLQEAGGLPFQEQLGEPGLAVSPTEVSRLAGMLRFLFIVLAFVVGGLTVMLPILAFRSGLKPFLKVSLLCLVGTQACLALSALAGIGTPRYTMGVWPLIAASLAFTAAGALDWLTGGLGRIAARPKAHAGLGRQAA